MRLGKLLNKLGYSNNLLNHIKITLCGGEPEELYVLEHPKVEDVIRLYNRKIEEIDIIDEDNFNIYIKSKIKKDLYYWSGKDKLYA